MIAGLFILWLFLPPPSYSQTPLVPAAESESDRLLALFDIDPSSIYGAQAIYVVSRDNKDIGEHTLAFSRSGDMLTVDVESRLKVKYFGVTVYRYSYQAREIWRDSQFSSVETVIHDNRKAAKKITALVKNRLLEVTQGDRTRSAAKVAFPSNHWHPGVLNSARLFHTLHGKVYPAQPRDLGWEKVALASGDVVSAKHYEYSQGFRAHVWYDREYRWVKLEFLADDGSAIRYSCKRCSAN